MIDQAGISQWFVKFLSRNGCRKDQQEGLDQRKWHAPDGQGTENLKMCSKIAERLGLTLQKIEIFRQLKR